MASIRGRARCKDCRKLLTLVGERASLLPPHGDCPAGGSKRYGQVYWQATVKWPGIKPLNHSASTRTAVREWARQTEDDLAAGPAAVQAPMPTLAEWHGRWWAARVTEPTTRRNDEQKIRSHILPRWGDRLLENIGPMEIQTWVAELHARPLAADTVRKIHNLLSQMLDAAVREQLLPANPCKGSQLPALPPGRDVFFTRPEVDALAGAGMPEPFGPVTLVLAYTGLRWGELAGLQVGAVDLDGNVLHVARTMTREGPKAYPKSRKRRTLLIPQRARDVLVGHLEAEEERHGGPLPVDRLVFVGSRRGNPLNGQFFSRTVFQRALAGARVNGRPIGKEGRPHDLRHTCASWLVQAGVPLLDVAAWLGHEDMKSVLRYAHLAPDHGNRAVTALDAPVPPVVPPRRRNVRRRPVTTAAHPQVTGDPAP